MASASTDQQGVGWYKTGSKKKFSIAQNSLPRKPSEQVHSTALTQNKILTNNLDKKKN